MAFRDLVESLQEMRALHTIMLSNNGIDDAFSEELVFLISKCRIRKLDLSHNNLGPKGIEPMLDTMKAHGRIKWIE
jgi:Ran GTPase-activating protein (RanGAP) involved in mRNA processing and transport